MGLGVTVIGGVVYRRPGDRAAGATCNGRPRTAVGSGQARAAMMWSTPGKAQHMRSVGYYRVVG